MSLGLALFVIFILYLIHANKAWKGAAKVAGVLLLLGAIGVTAIVMYSEHEDALETAKQKAEAQAQQEADARAAKDRWAELESMELCAKGDLALTGNQYPFAGEVVCQDSSNHPYPVSIVACRALLAKYPAAYSCQLPPPPPKLPRRKPVEAPPQILGHLKLSYLPNDTPFSIDLSNEPRGGMGVKMGTVHPDDVVDWLATQNSYVLVRTKRGETGWAPESFFAAVRP